MKTMKTNRIFLFPIIAAIIVFLSLADSAFALTATKIGGTTYYSDGTTATRIGGTTYFSDGTTASSIGGTTYFSNPNGFNGTANTIGGTTYFNGSNGFNATANTIGGTTYISGTNGLNGTIGRIGNTTYISGQSNPSCPLMSYYDSLSRSCKCMSGYVVDTNIYGNQSCVSGYNKCQKDYGIMATYDSLSNRCKCLTGYMISGGKCIYSTVYTSATFVKSCIASTYYQGKYFNGNGWFDDIFCLVPYNPSATMNQPILSVTKGSDNDRAYCERNFGMHSNQSERADGTFVCLCKQGYTMQNSKCVTYNDACRASFGQYAAFDSYKNDQPYCTCLKGYTWDDPVKMTKCVKL